MKRVFFLLVMSVFMCTTCTVNDEVQNSVPTSRSIELQKLVLDDNVSIDEFTERLNQEIDTLDLTPEDVEYLQTILSVAKNSHKLWTEVQK